jgi:hypothetical protein
MRPAFALRGAEIPTDSVAVAGPSIPRDPFNPPDQRRPRWRRWLKRIFLGGLTLLILLAISGAAYRLTEQYLDARRFPQQGISVPLGPQFGNTSLNLDCTGHGSPTVILDTGAGVPAVGLEVCAAADRRVHPRLFL